MLVCPCDLMSQSLIDRLGSYMIGSTFLKLLPTAHLHLRRDLSPETSKNTYPVIIMHLYAFICLTVSVSMSAWAWAHQNFHLFDLPPRCPTGVGALPRLLGAMRSHLVAAPSSMSSMPHHAPQDRSVALRLWTIKQLTNVSAKRRSVSIM